MTLQSYKNIIRPTRYVIFTLGINKMIVFVNQSPREPEIPFGRSAPPSSSAQCFPLVPFPFRHHSLAKRNGARRRHQTRSRTRKGTQQKSPSGGQRRGIGYKSTTYQDTSVQVSFKTRNLYKAKLKALNKYFFLSS